EQQSNAQRSGEAIENRVLANTSVGIDAHGTAQILGNQVYSNLGGGIRAAGLDWFGTVHAEFEGQIHNNLVYANTGFGIRVAGTTNEPSIFNNTIHQAAGPALLVEASPYLLVRNNIFWAENGPAVAVAADAQGGFDSDRNLFFVPAASAHAGTWNDSLHASLSSWQAASGQDELSVAGNPRFLNPSGTDGVLGYRWGAGYDGGRDDNFRIGAGSLAIDRGETLGGPPLDKDGNTRYDDPETQNLGSAGQYAEEILGESYFTGSGSRVVGSSVPPGLAVDLSFEFPYFDDTYEMVFVSEKGFLQLGPRKPIDTHGFVGFPEFEFPDGFEDDDPDRNSFGLYPRIAPLWAEITVEKEAAGFFGSSPVFFVDESVAGQVTIRWEGENPADGSEVNFSVTLFESGEIQFDYGAGNTVFDAIVGLSEGGDRTYVLSGYDGSSVLTHASSVRFDVRDGFVDLGAYEYVGSRDVTPPGASLIATPTLNRGMDPLTFRITYTDDTAVDLASIQGNDQAIQITGPKGFSRMSTFVSVDSSGDGSPRVVTYEVAAPEGGWTSAHNGLYTVVVRPGQVMDTAGNFVPGGLIANFLVDIEPALPMAADYTFVFEAGQKLDVPVGEGLLSNALGGDGATLTPVLLDWPARGIFSLELDGSFSYTPEPGFSGVDSFTYQLDDGLSRSGVGTVVLSGAHIPAEPEVGFADWLSSNFTPAERSNPAVSGPDADPDNTGISNLMRYAIGLERGDSDLSRLPQSDVASTDSGYFVVLTFIQSKAATDVSIRFEYSTDLVNWRPADNHLEVASRADGPGPGLETIALYDVRAVEGAPPRFYRPVVVAEAGPGQPDPDPESELEKWVFRNFTPEERDLGLSDPDADPDNTGITNLMRYALGLERGDSDLSRLPQSDVASTDSGYFVVLTFIQSKAATDVSIRFEYSTDLVNWRPADNHLDVASRSDGPEPGLETVALYDIRVTDQPRFYRAFADATLQAQQQAEPLASLAVSKSTDVEQADEPTGPEAALTVSSLGISSFRADPWMPVLYDRPARSPFFATFLPFFGKEDPSSEFRQKRFHGR
ncbi:MAG: Ig-like domain-containing protein, partial [Opitutales bacterium]